MTSQQQPTNHAALCANCVIAAVESADKNNDMLLHPPPSLLLPLLTFSSPRRLWILIAQMESFDNTPSSNVVFSFSHTMIAANHLFPPHVIVPNNNNNTL